VRHAGGGAGRLPASARHEWGGAINLAWGAWPAGRSGLDLTLQAAILDGAAVCGVSLSNALRGSVP